MMHLFIVNPIAGGKDSTEAVRAKAEAVFKDRDDEFEIYVTRCAMDAPVKVREAAARYEHVRVYACGGDGTFNECVSGAVGLENVAVCPFPTGTGNDFCRMFGDEKDMYRDLGALVNGSEHDIDLIECNGRYSANICSVGIDARIGVDVHKYSALPIIGGSMGYVVSTVVNVLKNINTKMHVVADGYDIDAKHALVCACNGRFYGGGFNPSLNARPDDGIMDVFIIRKVSLFTLARLIGKYASGQADSYPSYITHLTPSRVDFSFKDEQVFQLDGEELRAEQAYFRMLPKAVKLIVPEGMRFFEQPVSSPEAVTV